MRNRNLTKKIAAALAAGTLLCTTQAWASEDSIFQLDQITVTADRIVQTVGTTPANTTVISGADLQNKGAHTLADALQGVTGVTIRNYGGTGQKAIPYMLGTDRVVVLIDGKRMNLPQGIGTGSGGVDLNTFILGDNIDRIEVVHGGASVLYGADAVGGVINIITKKGDTSTKTTTSIAGGNDGARYYALTTGGQEKNTRWYFSGIQDSNDGQRANSNYKGKNASFRIDHDLTAQENLTFTYDYYDSHAGIPGSLTYPSLTDFQDILRRNWSAGYTKQHQDGTRTFRYYNNDQVYSGENYGYFRHHNTVKALEYQDSTSLDQDNLITWGGEWRKDEVTSTAEGNILRKGITKALFIQDKYSLNPAATLTVGLRRDDNSIYGAHWLPKAAYLYQASPTTSYFANWGKVFKAPKFDDLYGDDGWGNTGNPDLKPETGWTAEVGVKTKLTPNHEAILSLFKRNLNNAIDWEYIGSGKYRPNNIDNYRATGVNVSLTSKLNAITTTEIGYTYLDSHDQNNKDLGDPRHSFNIGINIHDGKLSQTVNGIYQAKSGSSGAKVDGRFIVNTNTNYSIDKDTSLFLTINNLFDKHYQSVYDYPANGRTILLGVKQSL